MILRDVKEYLTRVEKSSLDEIAFHLKSNREVIEHTLYLLIQKGMVEEQIEKPACQGCSCGGLCEEKKVYINKA